jgi:Tol biopolymer transport system component
MLRRSIVAGFVAVLAAPMYVIAPASAAVLFGCTFLTGAATVSPGLSHSATAQSVSTALPGDVRLASTSANGSKANAASSYPSLSADGTKVAFQSAASNLDPNMGFVLAIYVKDLVTGEVTLASGVGGDGPFDPIILDSWDPSLSADGTKVAFTSKSYRLDPRDSDAGEDVYVTDLTDGIPYLASVRGDDTKGNDLSYSPSLSADGTRVAFQSRSTNLDDADSDGLEDIYVKDLTPTGAVRLASTSDAGIKGNEYSEGPSLSADGGRVAFQSYATNLDPAHADAFETDVYVKDLNTGDLTLASTSDAGIKNDGSSGSPSLSNDGTRVAFHSEAMLDPVDPHSGFDVYVKDLSTGDTTLASASDSGGHGGGWSQLPSLAPDGARVAFRSLADLDGGADSGDPLFDIFVKDLETGEVVLVSTSDAGFKANASSYDPSLSTDGAKVAFFSEATNLDAADSDSVWDVMVKEVPTADLLTFGGCDNGDGGNVRVGSGAGLAAVTSFPSRPLDCPFSFSGAAPGDYPDQTPILIGSTPSPPNFSFTVDWGLGGTTTGLAKVKAGPPGTTDVRVVLVIATGGGKYAPTSSSEKTKIKGKVAFAPADTFNCANDSDPISSLSLSLPAGGSLIAQRK